VLRRNAVLLLISMVALFGLCIYIAVTSFLNFLNADDPGLGGIFVYVLFLLAAMLLLPLIVLTAVRVGMRQRPAAAGHAYHDADPMDYGRTAVTSGYCRFCGASLGDSYPNYCPECGKGLKR
jgi:hypothetical protein